MADGILYCLSLNLSMDFRVTSRSPVTCKTKLYVTTVSNSFHPLTIFCPKGLHLRGRIKFDFIVKLMEFDHVFPKFENKVSLN